MKKFLVMVTVSFLFAAQAQAKLKVVTTIPDLKDLAQQVGGEMVQVESLARGDQDPHFLEPRPSYVVKVSQADLLIAVGLELEAGWLPTLLTQSRNGKIQAGPGHLDASEGLAVIEVPTGVVDRSQGDVHPLGNPHYWLDPRLGLVMVEKIAERLMQIDAQNVDGYAKNLQEYRQKLTAHISRWEVRARPLRGMKVVTYHRTLNYFAQWLGIEVRDYVEIKPGIPPSPKHLLALIEKIRSEKIAVVIVQDYQDVATAKKLAAEAGVSLLILPASVGGAMEATSYERLFDSLIDRLLSVVEKKS